MEDMSSTLVPIAATALFRAAEGAAVEQATLDFARPCPLFGGASGRRVRAGQHRNTLEACVIFLGVCIPWRDAYVNSGRKDRKPWEDHPAGLTGFQKLRGRFPQSRTVVLGDFNQRIPWK